MPRFSIVAPLFLVAAAGSCSNDGGSSGGQGGASATSGGASAQGGAPTTGGNVSAGGAPTTGGASAQGGSPATGGNVSSGGASAGSSMGGGTTGGATSSGGAAGSPSSGGSTTGGAATGGSGGGATMTFFVTSDTSKTGKLGGLKAADARCQALAQAAGVGLKTFHAYLSAENDPDANGPVNARDRIGKGPWYNQKGVLVAATLDALHVRTGDADVFITEKGSKVNGQWTGSPTPNEHDILTGSKADGTVLAKGTCDSWTSEGSDLKAGVGHADGLGPGGSKAMTYPSWNAAHSNGGCNDTAPAGGAGRLYCFAID
jgi:hypothetical protein